MDQFINLYLKMPFAVFQFDHWTQMMTIKIGTLFDSGVNKRMTLIFKVIRISIRFCIQKQFRKKLFYFTRKQAILHHLTVYCSGTTDFHCTPKPVHLLGFH